MMKFQKLLCYLPNLVANEILDLSIMQKGQELEVCLARPQSDKKFDWTNPYIFGENIQWLHTAGQELEVCLARPQSDKKFDWTNPYIFGPCPNYIPHPGYGGFPGNPYGSLGAGYGAATRFQQGTNAERDAYGTNGSSRWSNWLCSVGSSLEYRCRFHGLAEMIGATAQAELAVAMLMATVADGIDPTREKGALRCHHGPVGPDPGVTGCQSGINPHQVRPPGFDSGSSLWR
ncbi:hypothetical protein TEA_001215 [Camellia sinensis var. sinensis]|uniref:Uncharacterized protein n=1 Tax=Camellia sinensis var. sinensis TaxID=542762 RepID=A0A4V3WKX8_CAMSN|nr:hypothetical protein TEA_001215 [Camellia sinensis var. sinensis]